jgi:hypothetical protein
MSGVHDRAMPSLRAVLASLGSPGAAANARTACEQRATEDRAVAALEASISGTARQAGRPVVNAA